jgi:chorismate synthase
VIEGIPYGAPFSKDFIDKELERRQGGYGRGARMKIERDEIQVLSGVRKNKTIGSPLTLRIENKVQNTEELGEITRPRPGHADLAGAMKYGISDVRDVTERSSARETAARVAAGALANYLLSLFGIRCVGYVVQIGTFVSQNIPEDRDELVRNRDESPFYMPDRSNDEALKTEVDRVRSEGDTLGGRIEVTCFNVPPGLGSYVQWRQKLDSRLAAALMSVQTVKAVEFGLGYGVGSIQGSRMHDEIIKLSDGRISRARNNAGGIEGGMSNGQPIVVRGSCKPISTLRNPLRTVDLKDQKEAQAAYERSDVCVVPAASVIGEAVVAFEILSAFLDKFGADTFAEVEERFVSYISKIQNK